MAGFENKSKQEMSLSFVEERRGWQWLQLFQPWGRRMCGCLRRFFSLVDMIRCGGSHTDGYGRSAGAHVGDGSWVSSAPLGSSGSEPATPQGKPVSTLKPVFTRGSKTKTSLWRTRTDKLNWEQMFTCCLTVYSGSQDWKWNSDALH